MKKVGVILALLIAVAVGLSQELMTPERFQEIVARPGDTVPLRSKLAEVPLWTNAIVTVTLKDQTGKVFTEEVVRTAKTVDGKYIVYSGRSQLYHQPMNSILTDAEPSSALELYGFYQDSQGSNVVTMAAVVYNFQKKTYAAKAAYGEDYNEITLGSYSDTESLDRTRVYKDGVLFLTREVKARKVTGGG